MADDGEIVSYLRKCPSSSATITEISEYFPNSRNVSHVVRKLQTRGLLKIDESTKPLRCSLTRQAVNSQPLPSNRNTLEKQIINFLNKQTVPRKAIEIARHCGNSRKKEVNSLLYELQKEGIVKSEKGQGSAPVWKVVAGKMNDKELFKDTAKDSKAPGAFQNRKQNESISTFVPNQSWNYQMQNDQHYTRSWRDNSFPNQNVRVKQRRPYIGQHRYHAVQQSSADESVIPVGSDIDKASQQEAETSVQGDVGRTLPAHDLSCDIDEEEEEDDYPYEPNDDVQMRYNEMMGGGADWGEYFNDSDGSFDDSEYRFQDDDMHDEDFEGECELLQQISRVLTCSISQEELQKKLGWPEGKLKYTLDHCKSKDYITLDSANKWKLTEDGKAHLEKHGFSDSEVVANHILNRTAASDFHSSLPKGLPPSPRALVNSNSIFSANYCPPNNTAPSSSANIALSSLTPGISLPKPPARGRGRGFVHPPLNMSLGLNGAVDVRELEAAQTVSLSATQSVIFQPSAYAKNPTAISEDVLRSEQKVAPLSMFTSIPQVQVQEQSSPALPQGSRSTMVHFQQQQSTLPYCTPKMLLSRTAAREDNLFALQPQSSSLGPHSVPGFYSLQPAQYWTDDESHPDDDYAVKPGPSNSLSRSHTFPIHLMNEGFETEDSSLQYRNSLSGLKQAIPFTPVDILGHHLGKTGLASEDIGYSSNYSSLDESRLHRSNSQPTLGSGLKSLPNFESSNPLQITSESFAALNKNPISALMEYAQSRRLQARIDVINQSGPSHRPVFIMAAFVGNRQFPGIKCHNKKDGRKEAADLALRTLIAEGQYSAASQPPVSVSADNMTHFDKMAALTHQTFNNLISTIPENLAGRKVIAGLVMKQSPEDVGIVISIGTGNRCITGDKLSLEGNTVNDSHAEIITRRGFLRFLYHQLELYEPGKPHKLFEPSRRGKLCVKAGITFHLYISTAPCGDGALFSPRDIESNSGALPDADRNEHHPTFTSNVQGLLRTKMEGGEGTIPVDSNEITVQTWDGVVRGERLRTMSCTDKICRWNVLGLQGALLSHFLEPIYLDSLTLGFLYDHGHLSRAVCCRLDRGEPPLNTLLPPIFHLNHPWLGRVTACQPLRETQKTKALSINWTIGDEQAEVLDGTLGICYTGVEKKLFSRLAKRNLYDSFRKVASHFNCKDLLQASSYRHAKMAAKDFQTAKEVMFRKFQETRCGAWVKKPVEEEMFS